MGKKIKKWFDNPLTPLICYAIGATCFIIVGVRSCSTPTTESNVVYNEYHEEAQLKYWHAKSELVDEVGAMITKSAPTSDLSALQVVDACIDYEVEIPFVLAQGLLESHFGTRGMASRTNSVWNVFAYDSLKAHEVSEKGKFKHPNESIRPYLELLTTKYLINGKTEADLLKKFMTPGGHRYATYAGYEEELRKYYNQMRTQRLDSLIDELKLWELRMNR